jgi:iron-sulfur cluster repair protein YtfE (RIC family)
MSIISEFLEADHHRCDGYLADAETAVRHRDWPVATTSFEAFESGLRQHLFMEENILFPAFEQTPGTPAGPTSMMRSEHRQMLELIDGMKQAIQEQDADDFAANADVLHIMMGQHNMKEESILYPMSDRFLAEKAPSVVEDMRAMQVIPQFTGVK